MSEKIQNYSKEDISKNIEEKRKTHEDGNFYDKEMLKGAQSEINTIKAILDKKVNSVISDDETIKKEKKTYDKIFTELRGEIQTLTKDLDTTDWMFYHKESLNSLAGAIDVAENGAIKILEEMLKLDELNKNEEEQQKKIELKEKEKNKDFVDIDDNGIYNLKSDANPVPIHNVLGDMIQDGETWYIDYNDCTNQHIKTKMTKIIGGNGCYVVKGKDSQGNETYLLSDGKNNLNQRALIWEGVKLIPPALIKVKAYKEIKENKENSQKKINDKLTLQEKQKLVTHIPEELKEDLLELGGTNENGNRIYPNEFFDETEKVLNRAIIRAKREGYEISTKPISKDGYTSNGDMFEIHLINGDREVDRTLFTEKISEDLFEVFDDNESGVVDYLTTRLQEKRQEADYLTQRKNILASNNKTQQDNTEIEEEDKENLEEIAEEEKKQKENALRGLGYMSKLVENLIQDEGDSRDNDDHEFVAMKQYLRDAIYSVENGKPTKEDIKDISSNLFQMFALFHRDNTKFLNETVYRVRFEDLLNGPEEKSVKAIRKIGNIITDFDNTHTTFLRDEIQDNEDFEIKDEGFNKEFQKIYDIFRIPENGEISDNQKHKMDRLYNCTNSKQIFTTLASGDFGIMNNNRAYQSSRYTKACDKLLNIIDNKKKNIDNLEKNINTNTLRDGLGKEKSQLALKENKTKEEIDRLNAINILLSNNELLTEQVEGQKEIMTETIKYGGFLDDMLGTFAQGFAKAGGGIKGINADIYNDSIGAGGWFDRSDENAAKIGPIIKEIIIEVAVCAVAAALGSITGGAGTAFIYGLRMAHKAGKLGKMAKLALKMAKLKKFKKLQKLSGQIIKNGKNVKNTLKAGNKVEGVGKGFQYFARGTGLMIEGTTFHLSSTMIHNTMHGGDFSEGLDPFGYIVGPDGKIIPNWKSYAQSIAFLGVLKSFPKGVQLLKNLSKPKGAKALANIQKMDLGNALSSKIPVSSMQNILNGTGSLGGEMLSLMGTEQLLHRAFDGGFKPITGEDFIHMFGMVVGLRMSGKIRQGFTKIKEFKRNKTTGESEITLENPKTKETTKESSKNIENNVTDVKRLKDIKLELKDLNAQIKKLAQKGEGSMPAAKKLKIARDKLLIEKGKLLDKAKSPKTKDTKEGVKEKKKVEEEKITKENKEIEKELESTEKINEKIEKSNQEIEKIDKDIAASEKKIQELETQRKEYRENNPIDKMPEISDIISQLGLANGHIFTKANSGKKYQILSAKNGKITLVEKTVNGSKSTTKTEITSIEQMQREGRRVADKKTKIGGKTKQQILEGIYTSSKNINKTKPGVISKKIKDLNLKKTQLEAEIKKIEAENSNPAKNEYFVKNSQQLHGENIWVEGVKYSGSRNTDGTLLFKKSGNKKLPKQVDGKTDKHLEAYNKSVADAPQNFTVSSFKQLFDKGGVTMFATGGAKTSLTRAEQQNHGMGIELKSGEKTYLETRSTTLEAKRIELGQTNTEITTQQGLYEVATTRQQTIDSRARGAEVYTKQIIAEKAKIENLKTKKQEHIDNNINRSKKVKKKEEYKKEPQNTIEQEGVISEVKVKEVIDIKNQIETLKNELENVSHWAIIKDGGRQRQDIERHRLKKEIKKLNGIYERFPSELQSKADIEITKKRNEQKVEKQNLNEAKTNEQLIAEIEAKLKKSDGELVGDYAIVTKKGESYSQAVDRYAKEKRSDLEKSKANLEKELEKSKNRKEIIESKIQKKGEKVDVEIQNKTEINKRNSKGEKEGKREETIIEGKSTVTEKGEYIGGKKEGPREEANIGKRGRNTTEKGNYKDGKREGERSREVYFRASGDKLLYTDKYEGGYEDVLGGVLKRRELKDKTIEEGIFEGGDSGRLVEGKRTEPNGDVFEGKFKDGKYNEGRLKDKKGEILKEYKDGKATQNNKEINQIQARSGESIDQLMARARKESIKLGPNNVVVKKSNNDVFITNKNISSKESIEVSFQNGTVENGTRKEGKLDGQNCSKEYRGKGSNIIEAGIFSDGKLTAGTKEMVPDSRRVIKHKEEGTFNTKGELIDGDYIRKDYEGYTQKESGTRLDGKLEGEKCTMEITFANGVEGYVDKGHFGKGLFVEGKRTNSNGDVFEGKFKDGKYNEGILKNKEGKVIKEYHEGKEIVESEIVFDNNPESLFPNKTNKSGQKIGKHLETSTSREGTVWNKTGEYVEGRKQGYWEESFRSINGEGGKLSGEYVKGRREGTWVVEKTLNGEKIYESAEFFRGNKISDYEAFNPLAA